MIPLLHIHNSRTKVLALVLGGIVAIFVFRLFVMQVVNHDYYAAKAEEAQVSKLTIPAERGKIYAQEHGRLVPLVLNEAVYTAFADPQEIENPEAVVAALKEIAGGDVREGFEAELEDTQSRYVVLARQLSRTQAELLREKDVAGVGLQETSRRVYPEQELAAQLLGFVDAQQQGQYGIEEALHDQLRGKDGRLEAVTDVRQIPLTIGGQNVREPVQDGENIVLTIDRGIQVKVEQLLEEGLERAEATEGSVIVMEPHTGNIVAMANRPTYNPAKYYEVDEYERFMNKVVTEPYEAGSVIKTLTVGAGLDTGVITPESTYDNTGEVQVADTEIENATDDSIGETTIQDALHYSLNTGMVHILERLGDGMNYEARKTLYSYLTDRYLFGKETGVEQTYEAAGTVISPDEEQGGIVRYANMTFGQGMDVTMIQTAAAFSAAINGGTYWQPRLVAGEHTEDGEVKRQEPEVVKKGVLSQDVSETLRDMVHRARQDGHLGESDKDGYMVGGKTGTSEIIDPETGEYVEENSIGTYLGFGGDTEPKYVIMVQVKDSKLPGYAGTVAAEPIFADISNFMLDYLRLQPTEG